MTLLKKSLDVSDLEIREGLLHEHVSRPRKAKVLISLRLLRFQTFKLQFLACTLSHSAIT